VDEQVHPYSEYPSQEKKEDPIVIERKIETEAYWQEYVVTDQDIEDLNFLFLEAERPLSAAELGRSLVTSYCQREENLIRRQLERGEVYRPNGAFSVGETLVFPHLDFALGTVVNAREGHNREYGEFQVITVEFEANGGGQNPSGGPLRSFAAGLRVPHKLAFPDEMSWDEHFSISAEDLYAEYGDLMTERLEQRLQSEPDFVAFRQKWLPTSIVVDLHIGYMNIAEALIDIKSEPLPSEDLLGELDLPEEVPQSIKIFSLNRALAQDERFVDVGDDQLITWSLRRWVPETALSLPLWLHYEPVVYDRTGLDVTHLQLEREIDDEASRLIAPPTAASANSATIVLGYPHWRMGALPLTSRTQFFFPDGSPDQYTRITFLDPAGASKKDENNLFPGWIVRGQRYVFGLEEWFKANGILPGAYLRLERTEDAHQVAISVVPRRMQREWVYVASEVDGELEFVMQKRPIAYEYDELCVFDEDDRDAIDRVRQKEQDRPLDEIVRAVFVDLVKINPNGMVHSKTLYSAVNVIRRSAPGLVFARLFSLPEFVTAGDAFWIFQGSTDSL
jgi:hypothetical protein